MKRDLMGHGAVVAILLGTLGLLSLPAAQNQSPASDKTVPRTADGHPDLNGFWNNPLPTAENSDDESRLRNGSGEHLAFRSSDGSVLFDFNGPEGYEGPVPLLPNQPPYKPEYMVKVKAIGDSKYGGTTQLDPQFDCKPSGIPRGSFGTMHILQTPQAMGLLFEEPMNDRIIYTDGRPHPKDLDTSFMGHSIGHWEGDTLVVDTVGLNDETWLGGDVRGADKYTSIHSDKEHVIERFTLKGEVLTYEAVIEDPVMFARPWVLTPRRIRRAAPDDYLMQFNCITNDKGHTIAPSDKDKFVCVWCAPEAAYGAAGDDQRRKQIEPPATNPAGR